MNEYTFRFYKGDNHVTTKTFHKENVEDAYLDADKFMKQNKKLIDDWEYLEPKKVGTQKSPFGIDYKK